MGQSAGIGFAVISALGQFAFMPYYPFWAMVIISLDILVIWALASRSVKPDSSRTVAVMATAGALVRRWGGRAVLLAVTGVGLYVVAPSLLSAFGAWPQLAEVRLRWFAILVLLQAGSLASLWWLTRLALEPQRDDDADELAGE